MTKNEKEILEKVIKYTRIFKPLNPADLHGAIQQSRFSHYAMEYLEEILLGLMNGRIKHVEEYLEYLEENFKEFNETVSLPR